VIAPKTLNSALGSFFNTSNIAAESPQVAYRIGAATATHGIITHSEPVSERIDRAGTAPVRLDTAAEDKARDHGRVAALLKDFGDLVFVKRPAQLTFALF
jgi:hypothetical protein